MIKLQAQWLLDKVILDYLSIRDFHQTKKAFIDDTTFVNQNPDSVNFPHEAFLQTWWLKFYEAYNSRFPNHPMLAVESFDKVALTVQDVVANSVDANQSYASNHTEVNTSNVMPVMPSTHVMECSGSDPMEDQLSYLMSKAIKCQMFLQWNSRDESHGINLGGPTIMKTNMHATTNALPTSPYAGNNRSLQQASHQGWPSVVLGDTNQRTLENSLADQQIIAPIGGNMRSYGKQPAVQISGRKRKSPWSFLESVQKEKAIFTDIARNNTESGGASNSIYALTERAKPKGISIKEIYNFHATNTKHLCCHFNSQGEFLATAGHNGKVLIWELGTNNVSTIEGHAYDVNDVRFRPNSTVFATSSLDKTVKIWDAAKPSNTFQNLVGHDEHVMSIDYHPTKVGLLSSCDSNDEIRLWDVNRRECKLIFKGGSRQVRFQPENGILLASSTENIINIFDIETNNIQKKFQGHVKNVRAICWDMSGNFLASVSEDSARIWSIKEGKCLFELFSSENKFQSCTFHPGYILSLVIGSDKVVELWNPIYQSNITWPHSAHDSIISSLAVSHEKGIIASVSHDQWIKIWR